jgi:dihydropyrimidinase
VEEDAVRRALELARRAGCRLYVVHVSTAGAIAAIAAARDAGQAVFAETCPQYLLLDEAVYGRPFDESAPCVMSPPLRAPAHRDALRAAVRRGDVDVLATDHCAFTRRQKALGRDDFTRIPGGVAGVAWRLALTHTQCVVDGGMKPADWVRLVSRRPAEIFGHFPRNGTLAPGADADLVLWRPDARWTITGASHCGGGDHTVYEGLEVSGRSELVLLRGRPMAPADNGTPFDEGRFIGWRKEPR